MFSYDTSFVFSHGIQALTMLKTCQENSLQLIHSDKRLLTFDRYKEHPAEDVVKLWNRLHIRQFQVAKWGILSTHYGTILSIIAISYAKARQCRKNALRFPGYITWESLECVWLWLWIRRFRDLRSFQRPVSGASHLVFLRMPVHRGTACEIDKIWHTPCLRGLWRR